MWTCAAPATVAALLLLSNAAQGAEPTAAPHPTTALHSKSNLGSEWKLDTPRALELELRLGGAARLDDSSMLSLVDRGGLLLGAGLGLFFAPRIAFALSFEHLDLGNEDSGVLDGGTYRVSRDLNTAWLGLRLYPFMSERIGGFVRLAIGGSWQRADVTGSAWPVMQPALAQPISCSGSAPLAFALRAELGLDAKLSGSVRSQITTSFDNYGLSDDLLDTCVTGSGSVQSVATKASLIYRFDL